MAITVDCENPKELLKQVACLSCLSEAQLKMVLVVVLNDYLTSLRGSSAYSLPEDMGDLMSDGACYSCFSNKQLLQIIVLLAGYITYTSEMTVPDVVAKGKCLPCAEPGQVKAALMRLLCQIAYQMEQNS